MTARVAVVLTQLGFGGAEYQTHEMLRALAGSPDAPVLVVCLSEDLEPYGPRIRDLGYRLAVLPRRSSLDPVRLLRLRHLVRRERIELIHAVNLLASGYAWLASCPGGVPRVLPSLRGALVEDHSIRSRVYRRMLRRCPYVLVNSRRGARALVEGLDAPADRIRVVPNGVDLEALHRLQEPGRLRRELGVAPGQPLLGYVGKESAVKNVPRCVEVVARVLASRPEAHAVFVGVGLDAPARERLAPAGPRGRLHFLGPRRDVPTILGDVDALVLTSDSEGCPNVVLEALGLGTPVVAADVGDVAEILALAPGAGRAVPRANVDAYVDALASLLADLPSARAAARGARPRLDEAFGLPAMASRTVALWRDVLARSAPRGVDLAAGRDRAPASRP